MDTPTSRATRSRQSHVPTPKMSDRKKNLFSPSHKQSPTSTPTPPMETEMNILDGMMPLDFESAIHVQNRLKSCLRPRVKKLPNDVTDIFKMQNRIPLNRLNQANVPTTRNSPRNQKNKDVVQKSLMSSPNRAMKTPSPGAGNTNNNAGEDLGNLLKDTLSLRSHKWHRSKHMIVDEDVSDEEVVKHVAFKRHQDKTKQNQSPTDSPKKKQLKLVGSSPTSLATCSKKPEDPNSNTDSPSTNKNFITSIEQFSIPAETFYSSQTKSPDNSPILGKHRLSLPVVLKKGRSSASSNSALRKPKSKSRNDVRLANNVSHKIPRPQFKPTGQTIDTILQSLKGEKFKKILEKRAYNKKAEEVHKILSKAVNPMEKSRPLNTSSMCSDDDLFSDCEDDECQIARMEIQSIQCDTESIATEDNYESGKDEEESNEPSKPKKFFKSKAKGVRNAFTINNMRATVKKGRISLLPTPGNRFGKKLGLPKSKLNFSNEQAAVKDIIHLLDHDSANMSSAIIEDKIETAPIEDDHLEFRKRIPYKTSDPTVIEQQLLLLDFLTSYNICNEENFKIFIMDPENHKDAAARVVDSLIRVEPSKTDNSIHTVAPNVNEDDMLSEMSDSIDLNLTDSQEANNFRQRLPYNTNDPVAAEQQKTLLEFLIKNQICNEENFKIFIAEPEKHRDKTSKILQNYMVPSNIDCQNDPKSDLQNHVDTCMSIDPFSVAAEVPSSTVADNTFDTSHTTLESMMSDDDEAQWRQLSPTIPLQDLRQCESKIECRMTDKQDEADIADAENRSNNQMDPKYYPIFYSGKVKPLSTESTRKKSPKTFVGGFGSNQYQIDAGQKEFGATKCPECGLVYTVHEPEEEKLHTIYHRSLKILKFKGWIDEDIVLFVPEWGYGGRIIRLTHQNIHPKRLERIVDILNIIDKELGIVSNIVPMPFVVYLAVRRSEIVGFSLVQPIKSANRYICMSGVDYCTEDTFDVKFGISRIWVSPLNRRQRIATKLIEAIRQFTSPGIELSISDIAFSSPTEQGKFFAEKITKRKDFLMYHSF